MINWGKLFAERTRRDKLADAIIELLYATPTLTDYARIYGDDKKDVICIPTDLAELLYHYALHADLRAKIEESTEKSCGQGMRSDDDASAT